jgi:uncharacterized coiled-coil protein SlyX
MRIKKDLVVIVVATFCLTATIFMVVPTKSGSGSEYYPWADLNDDGKVDILDAISLANAFGTSGDAINKTALLLEVNETYTRLMSRMDNLNSSFIDLLAAVNGMNATNLMPLINDLNASFLQLQSNMAALNANIVQLQGSNASLWTSLTQLKAQVDSINYTLSTRIGTLESQVSTMSTTIAAMNASLIAQQSKIDSLNATLASLLSRVDSLEANYSSTIPSNSTYSISSSQTSEAYSWIDMQGMSVTVEVNKTSRLFIMFSVSSAYCTGGPDETSTIYIQAVANSTQAMPGNVSLIPAVQVSSLWNLAAHAHPIRFGAYSFDFYVSPVAAGSYTVKIQWQVSVTSAQCTGTVGPRSLLVMAIPLA